MSKRNPYKQSAFDGEIDSVKASRWEEILQDNDGNLTRAATEMGFCKQRAHALTKRFGLLDLARQLRADNDQPAVGRPRKGAA